MPRSTIAGTLGLFLLLTLPVIAQPPKETTKASKSKGDSSSSGRKTLPPKPTSLLDAEQIARLEEKLGKLEKDFQPLRGHRRAADAEIFLKAVRYAIDFQEWYDKSPAESLKKAEGLLDEANRRISALARNQTPWLDGTGLKVVGFYSRIDDSPQPYGVEIPEGLAVGASHPPVPLWIWLHGRGDVATDLNFLSGRLNAKKPGQFQPPGTIVIHPFGRYCNGWKSAGETDVFEARDDAIERFHVDPNRIALAGFSMGGAGAWHIGAHFADQWACVHAGAGFVDVKRYQKLTAEQMPPSYEQTLWGVYDVPKYARNFLNVPLIAYSGEEDAQRDAAEYMMEVLAKEGLKPPHFIGPKMGHKYHPEVIKEVQAAIVDAVNKGRNPIPKEIHLQTRNLAYPRMHWLEITEMKRHWEDARVDAYWDEGKDTLQLSTANVHRLVITLPKLPKTFVDGQPASLTRLAGSELPRWEWRAQEALPDQVLRKRPGLQGPIDDAFRSRFIVVLPDRPQGTSMVDRWVETESKHFLSRWRSLMRGAPIVKKANELTPEDARQAHLVLWGTPTTNSWIEKITRHPAMAANLTWNPTSLQIKGKQVSADRHVPTLIYPNPFQPDRYVVLNSGLTFREAHDRTNSLQNPKLPDWAILDISKGATFEKAGEPVATDFFNEAWR